MSDVLILGASARAAIHSARRAGLTPHAVDLFADRDATAYATVRQCQLAEYPYGLERLADTFPPMPWLYTGGLENNPELVDRVAAKRPLWGNSGDQIRSVRRAGYDSPPSTLQLTATVRQPVTMAAHSEDCLPPLAKTTRWVRKSYRSSGGLGVSWATDLTSRPGTYLQEFVPGRSLSAAVCSGETTDLLGVTEQLVGTSWLHAGAFQYAGSIGLLPNQPDWADKLASMLDAVASAGNLQRNWGIDFVESGDELVLIEINPRYTASVEVVEHAGGGAALAGRREWYFRKDVVGKAVYYAPYALRFPEVAAIERAIEVAADPWALPEYADIPAVGSVIDAGRPVLSFFERAVDVEACREALKRRAAELDALFARSRVEVSP